MGPRMVQQPDSLSNRRRADRSACRLKIPCSAQRIVEEGPRDVTVRAVSATNILCQVEQPFSAGMNLSIDLPGLPRPSLVRVTQVRPRTGTGRPTWELTGAFVKALSPVELQRVQARATPAPRRRTQVRQAGFRTRCRTIRVLQDGPWLITVQNVSQRGLGFVAFQEIQPGTFLKVEVPGVNRKHLKPRLLKVTHARHIPEEQEWFLGGVFLKELTEEEVRALL